MARKREQGPQETRGVDHTVGPQESERVSDPSSSSATSLTGGDFYEEKIPTPLSPEHGEHVEVEGNVGSATDEGAKSKKKSSTKPPGKSGKGSDGKESKLKGNGAKVLETKFVKPACHKKPKINIKAGETPESPVTLTGARSTLGKLPSAANVESIRNLHNKQSKNVYGTSAICRVVISPKELAAFLADNQVRNTKVFDAALRDERAFAEGELIMALGAGIATALDAAVCNRVTKWVGRNTLAALRQVWLSVNFFRMHDYGNENPEIVFHSHFACGTCAKGEEQLPCTLSEKGIYVDCGLLAYLRTYTTFRDRNPNLMATCLARCKTYQREYSMSDHCLARVMPGTVLAAYMRSEEERNALCLADSKAFRETTRQFTGGIRRVPYAGFWSAFCEDGWAGLHNQYHGQVTVVGRQ